MMHRRLRESGRSRWAGGPRARAVAAAAALACAVGLAIAPPAAAAPPPNDDLANAVALSVPDSVGYLSVAEATTQVGEPGCSWYGGNTVWYSLTTPTDTPVRISATASFMALALYTTTDTTDASTLSSIACQPDGSSLTATLTGGTTYYLQVQSGFGDPITDLTVARIVRPSNDNFADAQAISFGQSVPADTTDATTETGEPFCQWGMDGPSVWFAFTAPRSQVYAVTPHWTSYNSPLVGVYTGSAIPLTQVGCGNPAGFIATAGVTYWVQALGMAPGSSLQVTDAPAPSPSVQLWSDSPMAGRATQFMSYGTTDPVGLYPTTVVWAFGDGTSGTGDQSGYATHTYAKDGDYLVKVTSTTTDGRRGTGSLLVQVRTHDVSVVSFTAPKKARSGQSATFVAGLRNTHYAETVDVTLLRGGPDGWVEVTTSTVSLAVKSGNKTTSINLPYVFAAADATASPVSFKVRVALRGPELQTTDNEMICAPVRVTK